MRTRFIAATLLAAVSLTLSACGGDDQEAAFNDADVSFATDMIPHHRQATEMAALAPDRTDNQGVLTLAADIKKAQEPEITTMTGWLTSWGKDVPSDTDDMGGMAGMDHSSSAMPGMMSDSQMADLEAATGDDFDRLFLTMMIEHHVGAIEMAEDEEANGTFDDAVALARTIQKDQAGEITQMRMLLDQ